MDSGACALEKTGEQSTDCGCAIEKVFRCPFNTLSYEEKSKLIEDGPPRQEISLQTKSKAFTRRFNASMYDSVPWLCGCKKLKKLFCWPCILFSDEKNVWNKTGFEDMNNVHKARKRHNLSHSHIVSLKQLKQFGRTRIGFSLSEHDRLSVERYNENVRKNRHVLSRLIKAVCYLGRQELAFRDHDEYNTSCNKGNYCKLLHELGEFDIDLRNHLQNGTVFSGLSGDIQDDIVASVSELMASAIRKEISQTPFVAIIIDETTDITTKSQLSTVLRYVTETGDVVERFLGFTDVSKDSSADALSQHLFEVLRDFGCAEKLVAQTYDGAAVMAGAHVGLQVKVLEKCPQAMFVHCYAHELNVVLSQSVMSYVKQCNLFFKSLSRFANFFSKFGKRSAALDEEINKRFPSVAPTRWNYNGRLIETIIEHKEEIKQLFDTIIQNADSWDSETIRYARGLHTNLQDFDFNFFLAVFANIFSRAASLFRVLQKKVFNIAFCIKKIENFLKCVMAFREDFDTIWNNTVTAVLNDNGCSPNKRMRHGVSFGEDRKTSYRKIFLEINDVVKMNIINRFRDISRLRFSNLLDPSRFQKFKAKVPEDSFNCLKSNYRTCFDFPSLKSELNVLYSDSDVHKPTIVDLCHYLQESELAEVFPEVYKLTQLIITIPTFSSCAERQFSALKRINTYLSNAQNQTRLSSLALLSIEKVLLTRLQQKSTFYDDVTNIFAKKHQKIDLIYKK